MCICMSASFYSIVIRPSVHQQEGLPYEPGPVQGFILLKGRFFSASFDCLAIRF